MSDSALVVGEALIDIVQHAGQSLGEHVGGSPLNVAVGLALLGRPVEFLTWIGDDRRGQRIADYLHDGGVSLMEGSVGASCTATAVAELDETGAATYQFDVEWQVSPLADLSAPLVLHTGSIATALEPGSSAVAELIDAHAATSTITFDPNIRAAFFQDAAQARSRVEGIIARSDVVKASDEDSAGSSPIRRHRTSRDAGWRSGQRSSRSPSAQRVRSRYAPTEKYRFRRIPLRWWTRSGQAMRS